MPVSNQISDSCGLALTIKKPDKKEISDFFVRLDVSSGLYEMQMVLDENGVHSIAKAELYYFHYKG